MLILEKEIREALTRTGLVLRSDNPNFYSGVFDGAKAEVFLHSGTMSASAAAWASITLTVEDPRIVGNCRVTPGAYFSTMQSLEQYPTWAKALMATFLVPVAPLVAVGGAMMTGIVWAAHRAQGLEGHSEVELSAFRKRFDLVAPSHDDAVAGCPEGLQMLLVDTDFVGSFRVVPGTFTVEPLIWGEKAIAPFVSNIPRLVQTITGS